MILNDLFLQAFDAVCEENKAKLDGADKARGSMEKPSNTANECEALSGRWDVVKKVSVERIEKVKSKTKIILKMYF